jgi:uncharacterized metal-binding protein YceD (DUF177 family)
MNAPAPEFSRPHRLDRIGTGESGVTIEADAAERAALARRFDLHAIDLLASDYTLRRDAAGIVATGSIRAQVTQKCVVTGDPVPARVDQHFTIRFLPEGDAGDGGDEIELDADDCDTVFYAGGAIDLGEAAAETLALALPAFPRSEAADDAGRAAGVVPEDEFRPIGSFAGLKDLLKGD